jgi:energy-coupling factor transport system ATP-binding protein
MSGGRVAWEGTPVELLCDADALALSGLRGTSLDALALLARSGYRFDSLEASSMADFAREKGIAAEVGALLARRLGRASRVADAERGAEKGAGNDATAGTGRGGSDDARGGEGDALVLESVTVTYGRGRDGVVALDGVSLRAPAGEVTLVAGPSGAGKTTAALVASGVLSPDGAPGRLGDAPISPSDVGLVLQRPSDQLFCDTVLADVSYGPKNRGLAERDAEAVARRALLELGVDETMHDRSPFDLSGGQRRRVALAGIVALGPRAYVFDEPAAGLDGDGRELLQSVVRRLAREGAAVIVVTHNPDEWLGLAARLVFVRRGRVSEVLDLVCERPMREHFESAGLAAPLALRLLEALDA